jgi:hypothetical protein
VSGHKVNLLPGFYHHLGFPFNSCLGILMKALSPLIEAGFIFIREKPSLSTLANFSFLGMIWGSTEGSLGRPWVKLERLHGQALLFLGCRFHFAVRSWS